MNEVYYLPSNQFALMSVEEKIEVKSLGAHRPKDINSTLKERRQTHTVSNACFLGETQTAWTQKR